MGLLCSHALKLLDFIRVTEIPKKHIVKGWTRDARDILPPNLTQVPEGPCSTKPIYRHFNMYMHAMELVRMRDISVQAYEHLISLFKKYAVEMKPFTETRDGLGLEDMLAENGDGLNQVQSVDAVVVAGVEGHSAMVNDDNNSANESGNMLEGLSPPAKLKDIGRPTTSREKAPYEGLSNAQDSAVYVGGKGTNE